MNYGLYLSAAGTLTAVHRQDVMANNLANVNTTGFKPDMVVNRERLPERLEGPMTAHVDPQHMLEQLGGGTLVEPTRIDLQQGQLTATGNPLDLAIRGDGFFAVASLEGESADQENVRLTRDGRMTLNAEGELVMAGTGMQILDNELNRIRLDPAQSVQVNARGQIRQNGTVIAQLALQSPADPASLIKLGDNLVRTDDELQPATGRIEQAHLEGSAVDPIKTLNAMIGATKAVTGNAKMMQYHDFIMGETINTFGRVA